MNIKTILAELESLLPGLNYVVSLELHRFTNIPDGASEQYILAALGPEASVGGIDEVALADMLTEVERCIQWAGDNGSHPDEKAILSPRLNELMSYMIAHFERTMAASTSKVSSFWLKSGHPHYPIQWDFAYMLTGASETEVFIGSSSD